MLGTEGRSWALFRKIVRLNLGSKFRGLGAHDLGLGLREIESRGRSGPVTASEELSGIDNLRANLKANPIIQA